MQIDAAGPGMLEPSSYTAGHLLRPSLKPRLSDFRALRLLDQVEIG
jgi:hypothetical protein